MIHYLDCADAAIALFALFDNPQDEGAFAEVLRWRESLRDFLEEHTYQEVRTPGYGMSLEQALPFVATGKYIARATGADEDMIATVGWDAETLSFVILEKAAFVEADSIASLAKQDWYYNIIEAEP